MERNYLLKVIRKRYILLDKKEISFAVDGNSLFDNKLQRLIKEQNPCLDDKECLPVQHRLFYEVMLSLLEKLLDCETSEFKLINAADNVVLVLSIYNAYSAVSTPAAVYRFMCEVEKHGYLILG